MAPSCWAFFLKFCPKLSWAGECGGVMEGIMLGGENNMLRPAPGGKFVPSYDKKSGYGEVDIGLRTVWPNIRENMA